MVSERELADLKAKLAERDAEIAALKNKCGRCDSKGTVENSIYCADCLEWYREEYAKHYPSEAEELLAERDRRIAELEEKVRMRGLSMDALCDLVATKDQQLAAFESAFAKFRKFLSDYSDVEDGKGDNPADVTPNWAMRCEMELAAALAGKGVSRG